MSGRPANVEVTLLNKMYRKAFQWADDGEKNNVSINSTRIIIALDTQKKGTPCGMTIEPEFASK